MRPKHRQDTKILYRVAQMCRAALEQTLGGGGVTLAQLVKASVGQAGVQRFESRLWQNCLSCCVTCKVQALWAPSGTNHHKAKLAISLSGWHGRYTKVEYLQSILEKNKNTISYCKGQDHWSYICSGPIYLK